MGFDPAKPYNDLPPRVEFESKSVLRKVVTARAALAELKGISETIPDPEILINSILMQEAKDIGVLKSETIWKQTVYRNVVLWNALTGMSR